MIRVLHIIGMMERGGAETFLMNLYRAIDRTEVQFDFLVHETRECAYDAEIRALGGRIFTLDRPGAASLLTTYARDCRRFFNEHRRADGAPEWPIVHAHMGSTALVNLREARAAGCYTVAHSHCVNFHSGLAGAAFDAATFPDRFLADHFMACSREAGIDRFGKRIVDSARFDVLRNGIFCTEYRCDQAAHLCAKEALGLDGRPVFGHVGLLRPEKNHAFLLDAFAEIRHELPDAVLLLVGDGPLESELRKRAADLGLGGSVAFLGSSDIVPELLKAMDVFVFPSIREGLGMALVEAQATGLPCLCSDGVSPDALVTDLAQVMELQAGPAAWAARAVDMYRESTGVARFDRMAAVSQAGFDIEATASWLECFYREAATQNDVGKSAR